MKFAAVIPLLITRSLRSSTYCELFSRELELDLAAYLCPSKSISDWLVSFMLGPLPLPANDEELWQGGVSLREDEGTRLAVSVW